MATDRALPGILENASSQLGSVMTLLAEANNEILNSRPKSHVWRGKAADSATQNIQNVNVKLTDAYAAFRAAQNAIDVAKGLAERAIAAEEAAAARAAELRAAQQRAQEARARANDRHG